MKKLFVLVMLISLLIPSLAFANSPVSLTVDASQCGQVSITATYGSSDRFNLLQLYVDDVLVDTAMDQNPKPWKAQSVSYSSSMTPGSHTAYAIGQELACVKKGDDWDCWWKNLKTSTEEFEIESCHEYSAHQRLKKSCDGWEIFAVIKDYGVKIAREHLASGAWTDPYAYETVDRGIDYDPSYEITFPDGSTTILTTPEQINEKPKCHEFTLNVIERSDCDGYYRKVNLRDNGSWIKSLYRDKGPWTDPYAVEMLPGLTVPIPDVYGDDVVFGDLSEPTDCQIFRTYKTHQAYLKDNCEGIQRVINLYEGPASDPYANLVGTLYNEIVPFVDPLILETIPAVTVDVPAAYGPDHTFAAMDEPEFCYSTCALDVFNRSWTEEILTPEGAVQVTTFFEYVDSLDPETVCRVTEEVEIVYESCLNAESTYKVPGEWTEWFTVNGPNKERSRTVEVFDGETDFKCGEYTEYDQECFADDFIWVWQGCGCSIRDRTYELYHFGSPPLAAQRAYCGCDFSCMDEGAWNDSGYVNNCQGEDYIFWDELPKWCGFTSCE